MPRKRDRNLDVDKVLEKFREYEESPRHHKGSLKIAVPFEQAVKKIAKAKPEPKKDKKS